MSAVTFTPDPPTLTVDYTQPPENVTLTVRPDRPGWAWELVVPILLPLNAGTRVGVVFQGADFYLARWATVDWFDVECGRTCLVDAQGPS